MLHVNGMDRAREERGCFFLKFFIGYLPGSCDSLKEGGRKQAVFFYEHSL